MGTGEKISCGKGATFCRALVSLLREYIERGHSTLHCIGAAEGVEGGKGGSGGYRHRCVVLQFAFRNTGDITQ
jgi:hypothetical protein